MSQVIDEKDAPSKVCSFKATPLGNCCGSLCMSWSWYYKTEYLKDCRGFPVIPSSVKTDRGGCGRKV
jgi:hypothetical protein